MLKVGAPAGATADQAPLTRRMRSYLRVRDAALARGGEVLTPAEDFSKMQQQVRLRCGEGHEWEVKAHNLIYFSSWCKECAKVAKGQEKLQKLQQAAAAQGGELVSPSFRGTWVLHDFRCSEGHRFSQYPGNVMRKADGARKPTFCTRCAAASRETTVTLGSQVSLEEVPWSWDVRERERQTELLRLGSLLEGGARLEAPQAPEARGAGGGDAPELPSMLSIMEIADAKQMELVGRRESAVEPIVNELGGMSHRRRDWSGEEELPEGAEGWLEAAAEGPAPPVAAVDEEPSDDDDDEDDFANILWHNELEDDSFT